MPPTQAHRGTTGLCDAGLSASVCPTTSHFFHNAHSEIKGGVSNGLTLWATNGANIKPNREPFHNIMPVRYYALVFEPKRTSLGLLDGLLASTSHERVPPIYPNLPVSPTIVSSAFGAPAAQAQAAQAPLSQGTRRPND